MSDGSGVLDACIGPTAEDAVHVSGPAAVIEWVLAYLRPWWPTAATSPDGVPSVIAALDPGLVDRALAVADTTPVECHMGGRGRRVPSSEATLVVCDEQGCLYAHEPAAQAVRITARDVPAAALAATRFVRELVRHRLEAAGAASLHAAAVARGGSAVLVVGTKGSGKTSTALALAGSPGWSLVANDRVLVEPGDPPRVVAFPTSVMLGLGLAEALGWVDGLHGLHRMRRIAPNQPLLVTKALRRGIVAPLRDGARELKAEVMPWELTGTFGMPTAGGGAAVAVLHPTVDEGVTSPQVSPTDRRVSSVDLIPGSSEPERYPDFLGLRSGRIGPVRLDDIHALPSLAAVLGHDFERNRAVLHDALVSIADNRSSEGGLRTTA